MGGGVAYNLYDYFISDDTGVYADTALRDRSIFGNRLLGIAGWREQLLFDAASEGTSACDATGSGDKPPSLRSRRPLAAHSGGVHGRQTSAVA
jgi:hypothetical protein